MAPPVIRATEARPSTPASIRRPAWLWTAPATSTSPTPGTTRFAKWRRQLASSPQWPGMTPRANVRLHLAVLIRDAGGDERFARVKVPDSLPALVPLTRMHGSSSKRSRTRRRESYVWIEEVIAANLDALFPGMLIVDVHPFHVTRDADIAIKELEAEDLLETIEEGVRQRKFGSVVRLQVNQEMPQHILQILKTNLELESGEVYRGKGLLGLSRLFALAQIDRPDLKYKPFLPTSPPELKPTSDEEDMFTLIRRRDILLHHPFQSFQPVVISCGRRRAIRTCWRS